MENSQFSHASLHVGPLEKALISGLHVGVVKPVFILLLRCVKPRFAKGLGFDSLGAQIAHTVAYGSPPLRCFFEAVLPRRYAAKMGPATRYTLRLNTASVVKIFL